MLNNLLFQFWLHFSRGVLPSKFLNPVSCAFPLKCIALGQRLALDLWWVGNDTFLTLCVVLYYHRLAWATEWLRPWQYSRTPSNIQDQNWWEGGYQTRGNIKIRNTNTMEAFNFPYIDGQKQNKVLLCVVSVASRVWSEPGLHIHI